MQRLLHVGAGPGEVRRAAPRAAAKKQGDDGDVDVGAEQGQAGADTAAAQVALNFAPPPPLHTVIFHAHSKPKSSSECASI